MRLVKVERGGASAQGVLVDDPVRVVGGWTSGPADAAPSTLSRMALGEIEAALDQSSDAVPLADVTLAVPIDSAAQTSCAGFNYHAHLTETSADVPAYPVIFKRTLDTLVAHGQPNIRPRVSETLDYEVVIGREGRHIAVEDAMAHVSGYSVFMDGSVREYQKHSVTAGKNFWRTGAMGPWVVTADESGDRDIALASYVDGERRQSSTASRMIFSITQLINYCSVVTRLRPGDVIATGTPGGVGARMTPPSWLKPGQVIEAEVEGVGRLSKPVEDEGADRLSRTGRADQ